MLAGRGRRKRRGILGRVLHTLEVMIDSETVRLFIWPFYLGLLGWGIYGCIVPNPISLVGPAMGWPIYKLWIMMHIPSTLFVLVGLVLRHGGGPVTSWGKGLLFRDFLGLYMQLGGHIAVAVLLGMYEYCVFFPENWGKVPMYPFFAVAPFVIGSLLLAYQTHRKIRHGAYLHKRIERAARDPNEPRSSRRTGRGSCISGYRCRHSHHQVLDQPSYSHQDNLGVGEVRRGHR